MGFAVPALAAGTSNAGPTTYYAQYGPDGVIHCAGYAASISTGGGNAAVNSNTYVKKNLYCVTNDSYPANYFASSADLVNGNDQICESTGWKWNTGGAEIVFQGAVWAESQCPSNEYFGFGFSQAAVNLAWQDGEINTNWVTP